MMTGIALGAGRQPLVRVDHPAILIDLAYATVNNFTGQKLYDDNRAFLVPKAAQAVAVAAEWLATAGLRLVILDAYRPVSVQRRLWEIRPDPEFVADPAIGSDHSRGVAVDVTLARGGAYLDMGTDFDAAVPQSHHGRTDIGAEAQANRDILCGAMKRAGFEANPNEWWHYALREARSFPLIEG